MKYWAKNSYRYLVQKFPKLVLILYLKFDEENVLHKISKNLWKFDQIFQENLQNLIPRKTYMSRSNISSCTDLYFCPHEIELWHLFKPLIKYCYHIWYDFYIFFLCRTSFFQTKLIWNLSLFQQILPASSLIYIWWLDIYRS